MVSNSTGFFAKGVKTPDNNQQAADLAFIKASADELNQFVKKGWKDIDYESILAGARVLLFGETDHSQAGISGGLAKQMSLLRKAGVDTLCIEIPRDEEYLYAFKAFNETGDISPIKKLAERVWVPTRFVRLISNAREAGLEIIPIDMPKKEYDPSWSEDKRAEERGIYMGRILAGILSNNSKRVAVDCGFGHLKENQIPEQLRNAGIEFRKVAVVTAGQYDQSEVVGAISMLIPMGASEAVRNSGLQGKYGYVNLDGEYDLNGFVYFPRVDLIEDRSKELPNGKKEVLACSSTPGDDKLGITQHGLPCLSYDFSGLESFRGTNEVKVSRVARELSGLPGPQKWYFAAVLDNYVRTTMRHGGGDIVKIQFDPESGAVAIDTVDTIGYPFNPTIDYGQMMRHREVTLTTLFEQFGFRDLIVEDASALPKTEIKPNMEDPLSQVKFRLLLSTYAKHKKDYFSVFKSLLDIEEDAHLVIKRPGTDGERHFMLKLAVEDFELNGIEKALRSAEHTLKEKPILSCEAELSRLLMEARRKEKQPSRLDRQFSHFIKRKPIYYDELNILIDQFFWIKAFPLVFSHKVSSCILNARTDLKYLSKQDALVYLDYVESGFRNFEEKIKSIEKLAVEHPDLLNQTAPLYDVKCRVKGTVKMDETLRRSMDCCESALQEICALRNNIEKIAADDANKVSPLVVMARRA